MAASINNTTDGLFSSLTSIVKQQKENSKYDKDKTKAPVPATTTAPAPAPAVNIVEQFNFDNMIQLYKNWSVIFMTLIALIMLIIFIIFISVR